jgi:hypothetical protein
LILLEYCSRDKAKSENRFVGLKADLLGVAASWQVGLEEDIRRGGQESPQWADITEGLRLTGDVLWPFN